MAPRTTSCPSAILPLPSSRAPKGPVRTAAFGKDIMGTGAVRPIASVSDDGVLSDIFNLFNEPYSPGNPGYVHDADWLQFLDFELLPEETPETAISNYVYAGLAHSSPAAEPAAEPDAASSAAPPMGDSFSVTSSADLDDAVWTNFFASQTFLDWYGEHLASGVSPSTLLVSGFHDIDSFKISRVLTSSPPPPSTPALLLANPPSFSPAPDLSGLSTPPSS
ncbi:hypothetical protein NliqN6_5410 [Naganishia liquefaciens]|uniref:Uncharacterized protein n=1 Tax=Naganishia liquefaciens TaxID=104408 RepID=A0A8H3TXQ1_9TREE|nr:hypothetical protein NliqN6_5410 [Naganishia liquefaciens]